MALIKHLFNMVFGTRKDDLLCYVPDVVKPMSDSNRKPGLRLMNTRRQSEWQLVSCIPLASSVAVGKLCTVGKLWQLPSCTLLASCVSLASCIPLASDISLASCVAVGKLCGSGQAV